MSEDPTLWALSKETYETAIDGLFAPSPSFFRLRGGDTPIVVDPNMPLGVLYVDGKFIAENGTSSPAPWNDPKTDVGRAQLLAQMEQLRRAQEDELRKQANEAWWTQAQPIERYAMGPTAPCTHRCAQIVGTEDDDGIITLEKRCGTCRTVLWTRLVAPERPAPAVHAGRAEEDDE